VRESRERRLAQRTGLLHALDEFRVGRQRAVDATFHAAVENEVGGLEGERFSCELEGCFLGWGGRWCGSRRSSGSASAGPAIARRVQAEHGLSLFQQLNHGIEALLRRCLGVNQDHAAH
jgi:hypothetical protein